jgi:[acyl-carrier-protein] S-malonyltransferase
MGKALAAALPECRDVFEEADRAAGFSLAELCFEGPEADLQLTANTQPAILAASLAAFRALSARGVCPSYVAGHSLGEYSALVAAGTLSLAEAVVAVRRRGQYMQEAVPGAGAMARSCLTCRPESVPERAEVRWSRPRTSTLRAGRDRAAAAVDQTAAVCRPGASSGRSGSRFAPFHCALMAPGMNAGGPRAWSSGTGFPVVNNVDADVARTGAACRDALIRQVSAPVRWLESVERLLREGVVRFVEVGPGGVLAGLVRKVARQARVWSVEDPESLDRAVAELSSGDGVEG